MNFWNTVAGQNTVYAIQEIARDIAKPQQTHTVVNSEVQGTIEKMVSEGYSVIHIVPNEKKTLIVYK